MLLSHSWACVPCRELNLGCDPTALKNQSLLGKYWCHKILIQHLYSCIFISAKFYSYTFCLIHLDQIIPDAVCKSNLKSSTWLKFTKFLLSGIFSTKNIKSENIFCLTHLNQIYVWVVCKSNLKSSTGSSSPHVRTIFVIWNLHVWCKHYSTT